MWLEVESDERRDKGFVDRQWCFTAGLITFFTAGLITFIFENREFDKLAKNEN